MTGFLRKNANWLPAACFIWLTCLIAATHGQQTEVADGGPVSWRTGAELTRHLRVKVSVQWKDAELRPRLSHFSANQRVALFLDRRIDPNQKLHFAVADLPLAKLLDHLAGSVGAACVSVGPVTYIGPPPAAAALAQVLPQRRKETARRAKLARATPQPLLWEDLAEPRQLLLDLARRHALSVVNPEAVPHDLWPAADLPPLALAEQLSLLLVGFDLTFELSPDGTQVKLVPFPADLRPVAAAQQPAGHGTKTKSLSPPTTTYTLTVMNESAGAVVSTVARRLGRQVQCTGDVREKLTTKVNLRVSDISLDELMEKTLAPLGLTYRLTAEALEVVERP